MPESIEIVLIFLLISLIFLVGMIVMRLIERNNHKNDIVGILKIETSDPDGPYMFLELHTSISELIKHENIRLRVDTKGYISR